MRIYVYAACVSAAVFLTSWVQPTCAQSQAILPDHIPTSGDGQLAYVVAGRTYVVRARLQGQNGLGGLFTSMVSETASFTSSEQFRSYLGYTGNRLATLARKQIVVSPVRFRLRLYEVGNPGSEILSIEATVGPLQSVSTASFDGLVPAIQSVPVPSYGVQQAYLQIGTNVPQQLTVRNGTIYISPSVFDLTQRIRLVFVTTNVGEVVYTQTGDRIAPARLSMVTPSSVVASITAGSDSFMEGSTNLTDWEIFGYSPWWYNTNTVSIPTTDTPYQFFRAFSR